MRLRDDGNAVFVWLSARDTEDWATKPGAAWPCSTLRGKRLFAAFDTNGLYDLTVNGRPAHDDLDGHEFNAITADHIGSRIGPDHPCHFVTVGQFT